MARYIFTGEIKTLEDGTIVRQIARKSNGELGGWIEHEGNLSMHGRCWVGKNSVVYGISEVKDNAHVTGASVVVNSLVKDRAKVSSSHIGCGSRIGGKATVSKSVVTGGSYVSGFTIVLRSKISDGSRIMERAEVTDSKIGSGSIVGGNANVIDTESDKQFICLYGNITSGVQKGENKLRADAFSLDTFLNLIDPRLTERLSSLGDKYKIKVHDMNMECSCAFSSYNASTAAVKCLEGHVFERGNHGVEFYAVSDVPREIAEDSYSRGYEIDVQTGSRCVICMDNDYMFISRNDDEVKIMFTLCRELNKSVFESEVPSVVCALRDLGFEIGEYMIDAKTLKIKK